MKNAFLALVFLGIFSCKNKKEADPKVINDYTFSARRNDIAWTGTTQVQVSEQKDTLAILVIADRPNEEVLAMKIKFEGPGTYLLKNGQAEYYSTNGGDIVVSRYTLASGETGKLVITNTTQIKSFTKALLTLRL